MWEGLSETKKQTYIFIIIFVDTLTMMNIAIISIELFVFLSWLMIFGGISWVLWHFLEDWNDWMNEQ